ncbi:Werner Syndrome-like exonuclease [Glycine max]|nr:Werner Syndrome-like exonuclease [Glycine max]
MKKTEEIRNSHSADTSGGFGGDSGERKLADGDRSAIVGGQASGSNPVAAYVDGEEIEVVVGGNGVDAILGFGADGEGAVAHGDRNSRKKKVVHKTTTTNDKRLQSTLKRISPLPSQPLSSPSDPNITVVGVGIREDVEKLLKDYNLNVVNVRDLRSFAAEKLGDLGLKRAGLKSLALRGMGLEVAKPKRVTRSRWDNPWLTAEQVQYAAVDAFLSYETGRRLSSHN